MAAIPITTAPAIAVGDAIVALINNQTWVPTGHASLRFTAKRVWQVEDYKPQDKNIYVDLVVAEQEKEVADRGDRSVERTFEIVIGVQKNLANKFDVAEGDAIVNFVGALSDFFEFQVDSITVGSQNVRCTGNKIAPVCSPDQLDQNNRFFSLIHLTFDGWFDG